MLKLALITLSLLLAAPAMAQAPAGYPADYQKLVDGAKQEGKVTVYSTTDAAQVAPLVDAFKAKYPGVGVEYTDLNSTELYNRFIAEEAAGQGTADLLWSSAMDLQVKLVVGRLRGAYKSPEQASLPTWAAWKDQAYGTTAEPLAIVYNKRLVPDGDVPKSHADLSKLLTDQARHLQGQGDVLRSGALGRGLRPAHPGRAVWPQAWDLFQAFGKVQAKLYTWVGAMLERIGSGEHLIGYDIFGSYALARSKKDPCIGMRAAQGLHAADVARGVHLGQGASSPNAAKLFLDFVLSQARASGHRQPGRALLAARAT